MPFEYFPMFPYASLLSPFIWSVLIGLTVSTHIQPYRGPDALAPVPLQELRARL